MEILLFLYTFPLKIIKALNFIYKKKSLYRRYSSLNDTQRLKGFYIVYLILVANLIYLKFFDIISGWFKLKEKLYR